MNLDNSIILPGTKLASIKEFNPGYGTYCHGEFIYSSVVGSQTLSEPVNSQDCSSNTVRKKIHVIPPSYAGEDINCANLAQFHTEICLKVDSKVICKITRVLVRKVYADIICIIANQQHIFFNVPYNGEIRKEDISNDDINQVNCGDSFANGDIVKAEVLFPGNVKRCALLSTKPPDCGVVFGKSRFGWLPNFIKFNMLTGGDLQPVSSYLMKCTKTQYLELRKVAKPDFGATLVEV